MLELSLNTWEVINAGLNVILSEERLSLAIFVVCLYIMISVYLELWMCYDNEPMLQFLDMPLYLLLLTCKLFFDYSIFQIENIRNKNADGMPLVMMLGSLSCSTCWLFFGMMLNDVNIYVSNNWILWLAIYD